LLPVRQRRGQALASWNDDTRTSPLSEAREHSRLFFGGQRIESLAEGSAEPRGELGRVGHATVWIFP
jgi:hypothetical protein